MRRSLLMLLFFSAACRFEAAGDCLDRKIGQLFIAGVYANREDALAEGQEEHPTEYIEDLIRTYNIGGVLYKMHWEPLQVAYLSRHFQSLSGKQLLQAIDAEWGLGMRMRSAVQYPKNLTLGFAGDEELVRCMGQEIGLQCRLIGINCNLAPVADVNSNPDNPVINDRSFGNEAQNVSRLSLAMMKGLRAGGVLTCVKHFPGHGDTATDSHEGLPVVAHSLERLRREELLPFKALIDGGVDCVMGGHILVTALDPHVPASVSGKVMQNLLRDEMGFQGVCITDDLLMVAISKRYTPGEAALYAFLAGNDLILSSRDIPEGIAKIKEAVESGLIPETEIDRRIRKIDVLKAALPKMKELPLCQIECQLHRDEVYRLKERLYKLSVCVGRDYEGLLPLDARGDIALVQIGGLQCLKFADISGTGLHYLYLSADPTEGEMESLSCKLQNSETIVVALAGLNRKVVESYGMSFKAEAFIQSLVENGKRVVVALFGHPDLAKRLPDQATVIFGHDEEREAQAAVRQLLFSGPLAPD